MVVSTTLQLALYQNLRLDSTPAEANDSDLRDT